jgi:hypothetical protein
VVGRRRRFQGRTHPPARIEEHVIGRRVRRMRRERELTAGELAALVTA